MVVRKNQRRRSLFAVAIALAVMLSIVPASGAPMASIGDVLFNGGFEHGFVAQDGCGMVGKGWGCFTNGGTAAYGFYDDMWDAVVYAGEHSQLIEINTREKGGDNDRNAGIYQTAWVIPGQQYELSLKGMIRADDQDHSDPWRYRVYVGFDYHGGSNWQNVSDWRELPWDIYYERTSPGSFSSYVAKVTPTTNKLTVFVRLQRKWGTWYEETDLNVDAISLYGPTAKPPMAKPDGGMPSKPPVGQEPPARPDMGMPTKPSQPMPQPPMEQPAPELVCDGPNLLRNGNLEYGFQPDGVAHYWVGFNNGGRANYGFYDETWDLLVSEGEHGQLIEINTLDVGNATDENRMAGIYQRVHLRPGATYELSLDAMMRERNDHSDEDFYRYMVLWGLSKNGGTDLAQMDKTEMVALDNIYLREAPGAMQSYSARFTAPSQVTTVWLYALKKWATLERELDVNLDNVQLRQCRQTMGKPVWPMQPDGMWQPMPKPDMGMPSQGMPVRPSTASQMPMRPSSMEMQPQSVEPPSPRRPKTATTCAMPYLVQAGDTLSAIAQANGTTVDAIMAQNKLKNPNWIYAGQTLCLSNEGEAVAIAPSPATEAQPAMAQAPAQQPAPPSMASSQSETQPSTEAQAPAPTPGDQTYRVQRGDTLSSIAAGFGTTVQALMEVNQITNPHWIYVGQLLQVPSN